MCLFRTGRNDSGEENVPLDLTRGNAGRRRGGAGPGARGPEARVGRSASDPRRRGQRGAEPAPIPLPRARLPGLSPSGPRAAAGARELGADSVQPATPGRSGLPLSRPHRWNISAPSTAPGPPNPGGGLGGGGGGCRRCYLGYWRMFEGRATTSCPPRPPEQMLDLLASCCLRYGLCPVRARSSGDPRL